MASSVALDDYEVEEDVVGEGAYSIVKKAKLKAEAAVDREELQEEVGVTVAIKQLAKTLILKVKQTEAVKKEKHALAVLRGRPHILHLYHTFQDRENLYFVTEWCSNGDMLSVLEEHGALDVGCVRHYAAEIVLGICEMRALGIAHRDIKPENLLLDDAMHIKVGDFGCCTRFTEGDPLRARSTSFVGTAAYVAPELLVKKETGLGADMWALGCCLYYFLCGRCPFQGASEWLTFENVREHKLVIPSNLPAEAKSLINGLLCEDEEQRLGANDLSLLEIKTHPFFVGIEWENISYSTPPPFRPTDLRIDLPEVSLPNSPVVQVKESSRDASPARKNSAERESLMKKQMQSQWGQYLLPDSEVILHQGLLVKKASLIPRTRMFLLTDLPRLVYIDPDTMKLKGEVPLNGPVTVEMKSSSQFFIHVPGRTYNLACPRDLAAEWKHMIDTVLGQA